MAEPRFASEDDLPRTLRRAKEERERERREREPQHAPPSPLASTAPDLGRGYDAAPPVALAQGGTVSRLEVPFFHLMRFFLKAVFAAIPALLVLAVLLWLGGQALKTAFPHLGRMQIDIRFVGGGDAVPAPPAPATPAAPPAPARKQ